MSKDALVSAYGEWWEREAGGLMRDFPSGSFEADAFFAGAEWMRGQCARVAEQAGWDFEQERAHGKYIAERIRDGDKPI